MRLKLLTVVISFFIFFLVVELIRREKITFKYAVWWLLMSFVAILLSLYEQFLFRLAAVAGFELTSNFIFFAIGVMFVFVCLILTIYICQQNNRTETMAQKIGILELELKKMRNASAGSHGRQ